MIIGTIASGGYLPRAMAMARSVKEHMPKTRVVVGIIEDKMPGEALHCPFFDEVILMKEICGSNNPNKFFFQYTVLEAARACKAIVMSYIYSKYVDENILVYLDAEMKVLTPFDELPAIAAMHPILVTGNLVKPESIDLVWSSEHPDEGLCNSSFLSLKRHPEAAKFLLWWSKLSEHHGYYDHEQNKYADQIWLERSHYFFDDVYTLRHVGYNVNACNIMERWNIVQAERGTYSIDHQPLRCLHFTSDLLQASSWLETSKSELYNDLFFRYSKELQELGQDSIGTMPWSYDFFYNGERISDRTKKIFRENYYDNPEIENPFLLSNSYFNTSSVLDSFELNSGPHQPRNTRKHKTRLNPLKRRKSRLVKMRSKRQKNTRRTR
ncbi:hypothetical protein L1N85_08955 [Paenibacillus alkaliterrae]|uniref:hypothetical protein n=1 Tax=Paenibacillus alkaliterrae TaxID=320909 RepID=UPI001F404F30|nr:hypothetical protein [Paenibacillus alkaliterrae]MCF2938563.1 hypothetical protein [Paenibacillus alkaliterrae]